MHWGHTHCCGGSGSCTGDTPTVVEGLVHALGTHPLLLRVWFMHWGHIKTKMNTVSVWPAPLPSPVFPSQVPSRNCLPNSLPSSFPFHLLSSSLPALLRLSYKLTHMYYNWPGTIRVPAPCQVNIVLLCVHNMLLGV